MRALIAVLVSLCVGFSLPLAAGTPPFSHMTLAGTTQIAVGVENIDRALEVYGITAERIRDTVTAQLRAGGIDVVPYAAALSGPQIGLLRVRVITNHDAHGFYHLSVKLELRRKILLGNAAGGFISEAVWTDSKNGVMLANEIEKITALVDELVGNFIAEYRAQNSANSDRTNP
ncbi:MAG: hypothetical protein ACREXT_05565 [Gammaproteobacteria bacterium]